MKGVPVAVYDEYVPYKLNPELLQEDLHYRPAWRVLESSGYKIRGATQRIESRPADAELAGLLEVEENAPILFKHRVVFVEDGTPIELILCHNRGDKYSVKMTLVR
jgi:GntR family transcriptional regulator